MMTDLVKQAMFRVNQGGVSNLDTLDLVQVPLTLIDTNNANFYSVKEIQDLKDSIALIGLKQPLVVLPTDGRYRLIAGHRRYQALSELGKETAPCVIQNGLTEAEEQLALILTNSTARELSYLEKLEQAKRLKELFMKRREEGAELPGRIRDMVAEAMNESASNLARMEKIDKHLIADWKEALNQGQISASTAYEIAKLPENMQQRLKEEYPVAGVLTAKVVQGAEKMKRREEGAELPGRIRDMVAEAMNESASNLARMEKIDKHLIADWKEPLNQGQISASTAYEIAKLPENMQQRLKEEYPVAGVLTAKVVQGAEKMIEFPFAPLNCPLVMEHCAHGMQNARKWSQTGLAPAAARIVTIPKTVRLSATCVRRT